MDSTEIFNNGRVVARLIGSRIEIIWNAPSDESELKAAEEQMDSEIQRLLSALRRAIDGKAPGSMSLLVVIRGVSKRYAEVISVAIEWLRSFRQTFSLCVFATPNAMMRSSIKVLGLLPGVELKGFETEAEARRYMDQRGA